MYVDPKRLYDYVFQRSHCDISDINTSYDYDYDHYVASGNQALLYLNKMLETWQSSNVDQAFTRLNDTNKKILLIKFESHSWVRKHAIYFFVFVTLSVIFFLWTLLTNV